MQRRVAKPTRPTSAILLPASVLHWSLNFSKGFLHPIFGDSGQTVFRAGYSMAYVREGMNVLLSILGSNPGGGGGVTATRNTALSGANNLPIGTLLVPRRFRW